MSLRVLPFIGPGFDCNQFVLKSNTSSRFDVVDAGIGTTMEHVHASMLRAGLDPAKCDQVVITHEHMDHTGGLPHWRAKGAKLITSEPVARKLKTGHDPTSARFGAKLPILDPDRIVADGDSVLLGGLDFQVLTTPGHSPGSVCYWNPDEGILMSGDTVFADGGIGRFDFPDSNHEELVASILKLERLPVRSLHAGHGPSVEGQEACKASLGASSRFVRMVA